MYIEPALPDFKHVTIRRTGGIVGLDQTLVIDKDLNAQVKCRLEGERRFQLDAFTSQELMQALATFAEIRPTASNAKGADMFNYDIELTWNGDTYRVHSVDVGADDALHGVMFAANRLMAKGYEPPMHIMSLHDAPAETPAFAPAAAVETDNGGIAAPWLQQ